MKAIIQTQYGKSDVLQYATLPTPEMSHKQVLVQVQAASINPRDWLIRSGKYQMQFAVPKFPLVLGSDACGKIIKVGRDVKKFKIGQEVMVMKNPKDGLACYAEQVVVNESSIALKPKNISFEQGAAVPLCALTAWQALNNKVGLKAGQKVLIVGGSGGVGTFAIQIAKALGAQVDAVCGPSSIKLMKDLGSQEVFDYKQDNFMARLNGYDVVFDTIGRHGFSPYMKTLNKGGQYVSTIPSPQNLVAAIKTRLQSILSPSIKRVSMVLVQSTGSELQQISNLIEDGKITPVIDSVFPLKDAHKAHDHSRSFRAKGKIILSMMSS
jgi:NADPH:quinone reductase-like Zn-dependent oxidoreductase